MRHFSFLLLTLPLVATAAQYPLKTLRSWAHSEVIADFNGDSIADIVIIATPDFPEGMKPYEDNDTLFFNANQPLLAIFLGNSGGEPTCMRQYDNLVPPQETEYTTAEYDLSVNKRGSLIISTSNWSSFGSWYSTTDHYTFRYERNQGFRLIGYDASSFNRNSGEVTTDSYNLLSNKHCRTTFNEFDSSVAHTEQWSDLAPSTRHYLGDCPLNDIPGLIEGGLQR